MGRSLNHFQLRARMRSSAIIGCFLRGAHPFARLLLSPHSNDAALSLVPLQEQKEIPSPGAHRGEDLGAPQEERLGRERVAQCDTHARILLFQEPLVHHLRVNEVFFAFFLFHRNLTWRNVPEAVILLTGTSQ